MTTRFGPRFMLGMLAALVAAIGVFVLSGDVASALVTLVGAIIAALVTLGVDPSPAAPAETDIGTAPAPARLGSVLEAIVEPVLVIAGGRVEEANGAARDVLGNHITGQDVRLAIRHPAAAERLTAPVGEGSSEAINLVGLGTLDQRWELRVTDLPDGRRVAHLIDQTRSYAAERMRVDFVANASHELRTPLASILGFAETLADGAGEDPAMRDRFLKVMADEARRMQRLVEDLISLSRIEAEKYRLPDASVDLADLVSEVHSELMDSADGRAAEIVADIAANVPPVGGDRIQLSQALHNLIGNAMKYGRAGTPVTVKLWRDASNMVRLSVGDEGDGIPPEHIPRLTERFYRVDSGRSRALGGTGLGLAIVKHIVERHRGRLDIASQVGRGTVVTILLPAALSSKGNATVTEGPKPA
ncbi:ATP-binding protein [Sphingomonas asaccharolytica]|uniref:ATP-binding protein n=1 Tax=Sphingomonas asaccharolytica TaxID=40681 RepID=UPI00082F6C45|nr:ATP-binding protein [Sphingomonas asaccharolytica]